MQLWTFEHKDGNSERFEPSMKVWRSLKGAERAADKWRAVMADLDCPSETQVCELVQDGTGRRSVPV